MFRPFQRLRSPIMIVVGALLATILGHPATAQAVEGEPHVTPSECTEFGSMSFSSYAPDHLGSYSVVMYYLEDGDRTGKHRVLVNSVRGSAQGQVWSTWSDVNDPGHDYREAELIMGFNYTGEELPPKRVSRDSGCGTPPNREPQAENAYGSGVKYQPEITVRLKATDRDGDDLRFQLVEDDAPARRMVSGVASIDGDVLTYVPDGTFVGTEQIAFVARDEHGAESDLAFAYITVEDALLRVPEAPVFTDAGSGQPVPTVMIPRSDHFQYEMTWAGGEPAILPPDTYPVQGGTRVLVRAIEQQGVYPEGQSNWEFNAHSLPTVFGGFNSVSVRHENSLEGMLIRLNGGSLTSVVPEVLTEIATRDASVFWEAFVPAETGLVKLAEGTVRTTQVRPKLKISFSCRGKRNTVRLHVDNQLSTQEVGFSLRVKRSSANGLVSPHSSANVSVKKYTKRGFPRNVKAIAQTSYWHNGSEQQGPDKVVRVPARC